LGPEAKEAFTLLKTAFLSTPILRYFDPTWAIRVETDASRYIILGILS